MLQRIQSIILLAATVFHSFFTFGNHFSYTSEGELFTLNQKGVYANGVLSESTMIYFVFSLLITIAIFANIFLFKNRKLQMKVCLVLFGLILAEGALSLKTYIDLSEMENFTILVPFFLFIPALIQTLIARKFIKKDEDLVRSVDRIR